MSIQLTGGAALHIALRDGWGASAWTFAAGLTENFTIICCITIVQYPCDRKVKSTHSPILVVQTISVRVD